MLTDAALKVGTEIVYTDRNRKCIYRSKKKSDLPVSVVIDEFLSPGDWKVVSESTGKAIVTQ